MYFSSHRFALVGFLKIPNTLNLIKVIIGRQAGSKIMLNLIITHVPQKRYYDNKIVLIMTNSKRYHQMKFYRILVISYEL